MPKKEVFVQGLLMAVVLTLAIVLTWHYARRDLRRCTVDNSLQPIASLLDQNQSIIAGLVRDGYATSESSILSSYLERIRKDGVPAGSQMKQRIDALADDNTAIVTLLSKYAPHARTPSFKTAVDQYRTYAISFRDRWESVFEIFMAGGNLPAAGPVTPPDLAVAVSKELQSVSDGS